ncbi:uncharacterized protein LOC112044294 [Bicyclus anynana]|uniref:Uncharacterized protein LOC112044294 n=1 Tax=Bicyclus anynana TaxID=110368 RepID=A0A6J1MSI6_BICAN|nr:uncharacterized protein LOC112044294 [Bicyclus anynana]
MIDESINISAKTWTREVESVNKVGYSDGVVDGQNASFQSSFDSGYSQGLTFGLDVGYKLAIEQKSKSLGDKEKLKYPVNMNCQICLDKSQISENVIRINNLQVMKNEENLKENNSQ